MILRRCLQYVSRQNIVLRSYVPPVRNLSLTSKRLSSDSDEEIKNNPDVKKFLNEIHKDFDNKDKVKHPVAPESDVPKESPPAGKNVSQLLSELYGQTEKAEAAPDKENQNFSSIGNMSPSILRKII